MRRSHLHAQVWPFCRSPWGDCRVSSSWSRSRGQTLCSGIQKSISYSLCTFSCKRTFFLFVCFFTWQLYHLPGIELMLTRQKTSLWQSKRNVLVFSTIPWWFLINFSILDIYKTLQVYFIWGSARKAVFRSWSTSYRLEVKKLRLGNIVRVLTRSFHTDYLSISHSSSSAKYTCTLTEFGRPRKKKGKRQDDPWCTSM